MFSMRFQTMILFANNLGTFVFDIGQLRCKSIKPMKLQVDNGKFHIKIKGYISNVNFWQFSSIY